MKTGIITITAGIIFFSCSSDHRGTDKDPIGNVDSLTQSDSAKLFVLPTPLQVATFLLTQAPDVHPEILSGNKIPLARFSTDYQRAMNLGICIADAGYAALYGEQQLALDYLLRCDELVTRLHLEPAAAPYMERVRNNIANRDSLSYLLLSMYNEVQKNLNEGKREKTAFYIVSGCYLENLAITVQYDRLKERQAYRQIIAQQKLWLHNLTEACTYLEPDSSSQDLYNTYNTLGESAKEIEVTTGNDNQLQSSFTDEVFVNFRNKTVQLRDEITGRKSQ